MVQTDKLNVSIDEQATPLNGHPDAASSVLDVATAYLSAGLSIIPIRTDGSKAPRIKWERYQEKSCADQPNCVRTWWGTTQNGIALVCGNVSGGREVIDFDEADLFDPWRQLVEAQAPGLVARLPLVRTPRPGYQLHYNCAEIEGNQELAREPIRDPKTGKLRAHAMIETRGEGGYVLLPGSPLACHKSGRPYEHIAGPPIIEAPTITPAERQVLLDAARSLDRMADDRAGRGPGGSPWRVTATGAGMSPGDDFNQRGPDWAGILEGWELVSQSGQRCCWRRPGKDDRGHSATTGYCTSAKGWDLLYVFSSNADPFEARRPYSKFAAYALLKHGGDFSAAARELARLSYGQPAKARKAGNAGAGQADPEQAQAAEPSPDGAGGEYEELEALDIILRHFKREYEPIFRRANVMYSGRLGREVKAGEACFAPDRALIEQLLFASNVPTDGQGNPKENAIPQFFRSWAPSAWAELLKPLPEEEAAGEVVELAQEQFRAELAKAMKRMITLAVVRDEQEVKESRSLIDWCLTFAKDSQAPGKAPDWRKVRSYSAWSRKAGEQVSVALRVDIFGTIGMGGPLPAMTQRKFSSLCELYGCGRSIKVQGGASRAVELTAEFVHDLCAQPLREPEEDAEGRTDAENSRTHAHVREAASLRPSEE